MALQPVGQHALHRLLRHQEAAERAETAISLGESGGARSAARRAPARWRCRPRHRARRFLRSTRPEQPLDIPALVVSQAKARAPVLVHSAPSFDLAGA
jgi:hypothetical protein